MVGWKDDPNGSLLKSEFPNPPELAPNGSLEGAESQKIKGEKLVKSARHNIVTLQSNLSRRTISLDLKIKLSWLSKRSKLFC